MEKAADSMLPGSSGEDDNQVVALRREKLRQWRKEGSAFPNDWRLSHTMAELQQKYQDQDKLSLQQQAIQVRVAGRILRRRLLGKASFATLDDGSDQMQLYVSEKQSGMALLTQFKGWDNGDIVGAEGVLFRTKTGELSVHAVTLRLLSKSLRPLPEKFHGLVDEETKYRQRYLDLLANPGARDLFRQRSKIVQAVRNVLLQQDFLEVETPMLHPIAGGATARPFNTYHNALGLPMYLRIAPELYLKRLIVGGFPRVFEINRSFRNEGVSTRHNPEFTMLEFYAAYQDHNWLMSFMETLLQQVAQAIKGTAQWCYQGKEVDFSAPFARYRMDEAIVHFCPQVARDDLSSIQGLRRVLDAAQVEHPKGEEVGHWLVAAFEALVEPNLWQPTFITDYPTSISPLARASDQDSQLAERFELFVAGRELANGFSELNDPEDQAARFQSQAQQKAAGDDEAMFFDQDYVKALEYAMPPAGGCGMGVDRLVMLLNDCASIREVILFPHLRPAST